MKKHVIRIMEILFVLIVVCQNVCYADVVWRDANGVWHGGGHVPTWKILEENQNRIFIQRIIIIGIVVIAIVVSAYLVLRIIKKKKKIAGVKNQEENKKAIEESNHDENELKKEKKQE